MKKVSVLSIVLILLGSSHFGYSQSVNSSGLRAGAAKVDITPSVEALPQGYNRINDRIYVRAIVIDNGSGSAALIGVDRGMVSTGFYNTVTQRVEDELGIPAANIFIAASHTHSSPQGGVDTEQATFDAVRMAQQNLELATISYNTGMSYLNINRDVIDPVTRLWSQGPNPGGPSDKTVAVITLRDMEGEPIAVYYNYAMHANMMFMSEAVSGDFPGMASAYIEGYYDNNVVAVYSSGAAGDQNPISVNPMREVSRSKTQQLLDSGRASNLQEAIMMAGFGGATDLEVDEDMFERQAQMIESLGQILSEEVLRVMELPQADEAGAIDIYASQRVIACPGRVRLDNTREGAPGSYEDGDPVSITLSLLRLGNIAITGVNAEVYTLIAEKLKEESPLNHTIFSSITNGSAGSGYIPSDDAFQRYTFQVLGSRLKPNCAERAIIDGLMEMIDISEQ